MKNKKTTPNKPEVKTGEINNEEQILMKKFLHEIFMAQRRKGLNNSTLASLVNISPGYLSQIFHSRKPLTFSMLIRFQHALKIEFQIQINPALE